MILEQKTTKQPGTNGFGLFVWQGQEDSEPKSAPIERILLCCVGADYGKLQAICGVLHHGAQRKRKSPMLTHGTLPFWQGQEDSNPRPTVLETGTLPAELYPCVVDFRNGVIISHFRLVCKPFFQKKVIFSFFSGFVLSFRRGGAFRPCPFFADLYAMGRGSRSSVRKYRTCAEGLVSSVRKNSG